MYWDALLKEVLDKKKESKRLASHSPLSKSKKLENYPKKQIKKFFLGEANSNIYFTNREAEVMIKLLQGKTLSTAAVELNLSPRTIEFYVKNMKTKLACRTKSELIGKVFASDFIRHVDFISKLLGVNNEK